MFYEKISRPMAESRRQEPIVIDFKIFGTLFANMLWHEKSLLKNTGLVRGKGKKGTYIFTSIISKFFLIINRPK